MTKWLVVSFLELGTSHVLIPDFFNVVHWRNKGAAWGIFQDYNSILAVVSVVTLLVLFRYRRSFQLHRASSRVAIGLIAGGIVGNFIDRIRMGYVVDFLDFQIGRYHWPAFNVADSAICIGVVLYILVSWRSDAETHAAQATS